MILNKFFSLIKNQNYLKTKNKLKLKLKIYKILIFIPSLFLLIYLSFLLKIFLKKYKKIISLRISTKYFGHLSIEPAIISAYSSNALNILPLVSIKASKGIENKTLIKIAKSSFKIKNDFINIILENIYNYSFENIRLRINYFYSPLIHHNLATREITYMNYLDTDKNFIWRKNAQKLIYSKNGTDFKLIIALRTNHFNKHLMNPQPWRDASTEDISYLCNVFSKIITPSNIYLYYHPENENLLKDKDLKNLNINFVDQTKIDILSLFSPNSILINNGNGIGSAALSIGIKTLYIHHTAWQFWHTSHANSFCIPTLFSSNYSENQNSIEDLIKIVFSSKSDLPLDFPKDYYRNGIKMNRIIDIEESVLIDTLHQMLQKEEELSRGIGSLMGCKYHFSSTKEKVFWENYIINMSDSLRNCHQNIKLKVSKSFLQGLKINNVIN